MENNFKINLELIPNELLFLLEIIKLENENEIENKLKSFSNIDWNHFLKLSHHHRVYPLIYSKVNKLKKNLIPDHVIQTLSQEFKKNTFQMLQMTGEMQQICQLFTENNVRNLFLKGPSLAVELYGDISYRTSGDLDILVPIDKLNLVEQLLSKNGYVKEGFYSTVLNDWKWRHHHVSYFHPKKKIAVEIHWRLNPGPSKEPNFNDLWKRKRKSKLTNYPVFLLGYEDLFFFLVSHGARHGWSKLRWLVDIDRLTKQNIDWSKIKIILQKNQYEHVGGQALLLASKLLDTNINHDIDKLISGNRAKGLAQNAIFYLKQMINPNKSTIEVTKYHKNYLYTLMSTQQKILFILSFLYPFPVDAETLPLPKYLHFLYFPLRPILWAWRKTRKQALSLED